MGQPKRQSRERLSETTQRLEALYNASVDGILMVDDDLKIVVANRKFGEFFGLDPKSVIGMDDASVRAMAISCFADPGSFQKRVGELYSNPEEESEEELELARPLPRVLQRFSAPVRDERGEIMGRLWIFRDITTRRKMERELEEKAAVIAEADRLKSEFLATTSHELRTPLNSLLGFLKLVLEGVCSSPEEEKQLLTHAYGTGMHLVTLLNDILDLAKIESGSVSLTMEAIDLAKLLEEVMPISKVSAQAKGLTCTLEPPSAGLPAVRGDRDRLRQVMINLIGNAVKYTPKGGVTVTAETAGDGVAVSVTDTGVGMDALTLESARSGHFSARTGRGVGSLGITISRRFLALMGAGLEFSSPGANLGTTALVRLARDRGDCARAKEPAEAHPSPAFRRDLRVLLVEDDHASADYVRMALERIGGWKVVETEDVARILELAATGDIDGVLMDVLLERSYHDGKPVNGLAITRLLKDDPRTARLPVVLMTAHAMAGDRERMLAESGADDYEAKPIVDFRGLMSKLSQYVG